MKEVYVAKSIKELSSHAELPEIDNSIPLSKYYKSAEGIFDQARLKHAEEDYEMAYILYLKFANLLISSLPKHKGFKTATGVPPSRKKVETALTEMEKIKNRLK